MAGGEQPPPYPAALQERKGEQMLLNALMEPYHPYLLSNKIIARVRCDAEFCNMLQLTSILLNHNSLYCYTTNPVITIHHHQVILWVWKVKSARVLRDAAKSKYRLVGALHTKYIIINHRGPARSVWVAACYFIVTVLDFPFASPIAIYR